MTVDRDDRPRPKRWRSRTVSVARGYRFELVKLLAQWRVRVLIGLCWIGPAVTVVVVSGQSTLPADTLFGREMHATGWAGALVVLGFAGSWFFPLLTSVVAGDVFSSEDRLGTWRHLLVAVRSPRRIFAAKALASLTVLLMCVPGLAVSGIVGGLVVGNRPLTGLDGHLLSPATPPGRSCWPGSACSPRSWPSPRSGCSRPSSSGGPRSALLLPAFGGLGMQLASQMLPMPVAVRLALPSFAFISWNGLFTSPPQLGPLHRRHRRQPGVGRHRDRAGVPDLHAARLHQPRPTTARCGARSPWESLPLLAVWALRRRWWPRRPGPPAPGSTPASCSSRWPRRSPTSTCCRARS